MRKKRPWKYALLGGLLVTLVLYGIEWSSKGIGDVYGPLDVQAGISSVNETTPVGTDASETMGGYDERTQAARVEALRRLRKAQEDLDRLSAMIEETPRELPGPPAEFQEPSLNKLADGTAGLLRSVTNGGIRFIVSIFDTATD
ncbi:hypothetical protein [Paenibacillus darwinianus]|nr:hypothetical protein [Paenibacillus darwinianus]